MSKLTTSACRYLRQFSSVEIRYPPYKQRKGESEIYKRKRLIYQSRKRGMTENGIVLSTFADTYLDSLDNNELDQYDKLINESSDDWSLYYWITKAETPPTEYQNSVLEKLQEHVQNMSSETPPTQPSLKFTSKLQK